MKLNKDIIYTIASIGVLIIGVAVLGTIIDVAVLGLHIALTNPIYVIGLSIIGLVAVFLLPSKNS